jgi:dienelactone hydrolase
MKSLTLVLLVASSAAAQPAPRDVDITAPDGVHLKGTYFTAQAVPGGSAKAGVPAVILLHMCNTTRVSWEPVAQQLAAAGINALTVDNRGFGDSGGPRFDAAAPDVQRELNQKWPADFDAALAWLEAQPGVSRDRIGVGGGSCGVNNAVQLARRHPEVRSLVLLAGPPDADPANADGLNYLMSHAWLPIFTAAAADDQYDPHFLEMMRWLAEITGNPRNKFVGFKYGRHGTEIFGPHPELPRQIVAWFEDTLITSPANPGVSFMPKKTPISEFWAAANQRGGAVRAAQLFRQARQRDPHAFLFPEFPLNLLAYSKLQSADRADKDHAVELFRVNTEAYPTSANAQDSLADGYIAQGRNDLALAAEQKCLELLAADAITEQFRAQLRKAAEGKIAKLKAKLH